GEARAAVRVQEAACDRPVACRCRSPAVRSRSRRRSFVVDVLPSMILLGFGAGIAFNPVLLAAMSDVEPSESGLASGLVNTSFMMGGALGLAVLASIAASRTHSLRVGGSGELSALTGGYHLAFPVGAAVAALAAVLGGTLLRQPPGQPKAAPGGAPAPEL